MDRVVTTHRFNMVLRSEVDRDTRSSWGGAAQRAMFHVKRVVSVLRSQRAPE